MNEVSEWISPPGEYGEFCIVMVEEAGMIQRIGKEVELAMRLIAALTQSNDRGRLGYYVH